MRRLRILYVWLNNGDVIRNVSVCGKDIEQAIEVVIEEEGRKSQRLGRQLTNSRDRRFISKQTRTIVVIKRHTLVREVADDYARPARAIIVSGIDSHPSACCA